MQPDWLITHMNWMPSTCRQLIFTFTVAKSCVMFQKHKEFVKTVKVEEIDGMTLVKNLAVKMEEVFQKKAEATRVSEISLIFNLKRFIYPYLLWLIKEPGLFIIGAQENEFSKTENHIIYHQSVICI